MVPVRFFVASLVAAMALVIIMFVACELPLHAGKSRVQLHIASDKSVSARDALIDAGIQLFRVSVATDGTVVLKKTFTETTITLELEEGLDRVFVLEALSGDGPEGVVLLRGETRADVIANQTIDLEITLVAVDSTTTAITGTLSNWVLVSGSRNNGGIATVSGSLSAPGGFTIQSSVQLDYGNFSIAESGDWTYNLDFEDGAVQSLGAGDTLVDTVTVTAGADTQLITITIYGADQTAFAAGQYVLGDGNGGGGGGAFGPFQGGNGGNGGGGIDTIAGGGGNDIIFGDGSGGGTGGRGVGGENTLAIAGLAGGGNDAITGGDGNDIIFGDGFDGLASDYFGGNGGFGGGGGGGSGANLGDAFGGLGGLGAGSGSGYLGSAAPLVILFGSAGGIGDSPGGSSAEDTTFEKGLGGSSFGVAGQGFGGGGGFGGGKGGDGMNDATGPGFPGLEGDADVHRYNDDTFGTIFTYVKNVAPTILSTYPNFGSGSDTINGGPGSDNLFGLGGPDIFVFELNDATSGNDIDIIWGFTNSDALRLTVGGIAITATLRDALIAAQSADKSDRRIVFRSDFGKQVTIILKSLGRDIVAPDFE